MQDEGSLAWKRLIELVNDAAANDVEEWKPGAQMSPADWHSIVTLPPQIENLKSVRKLDVYGSSLVRLPPEIGQMSALEEFAPYTSYRLHWLPFEITHCAKLRRSRISTRALYGNEKTRSPFPDLRQEKQFLRTIRPSNCSVCRAPLSDSHHVRWISLNIGTDVVPLLVFACSTACIASLPTPPANYFQGPHRGGRSLEMPRP